NPGLRSPGSVRSLALQGDGKLLMGGSFVATNGGFRTNIARLNPDGSLDLTFDPGTAPTGSVRSIVIQDDWKIVIGGSFEQVTDAPRRAVARLNNDGSGPLAIIHQPQSQSVLAGQDATFWVATARTDLPAFQWYFNCVAL